MTDPGTGPTGTSPTGTSPTGTARGQTLPDFAVGVAIFLVAITFVVLFVPQVTLPYDDQEQPVVAERVAADLGDALLGQRGTASQLDEDCTVDFFTQSGGGDCPFDPGDAVTTQLGIASTYSVNVTLRNTSSDAPTSIVCTDSFDTCESGSDKLAVGPAVPDDDRSVAIARRRVTVGDTGGVLEVGVW